jgi:hypothetical protein
LLAALKHGMHVAVYRLSVTTSQFITPAAITQIRTTQREPNQRSIQEVRKPVLSTKVVSQVISVHSSFHRR